MATFTLTVRHGPSVERSEHKLLEDAIEAMRARVVRLQNERDLPEVSMLRTFKPEDRVRARVEISTGRLFRRREAGIDVMGDGSVVPYAGGTFRRPLEEEGSGGGAGSEVYAAIAEALRE